MITIKPYMIGEDQYIDLPEEFNFTSNEVEIFRRGDDVILRKKTITEDQLCNDFSQIPEDVNKATSKDE